MKKPSRAFRSSFRHNWGLYLLLLPAIIYALVFLYLPMVGVLIAFEDYSATKGFFGSPWVGLKYFKKFIESYNFWDIFYNTIALSFYNLLATFPIPILFALLLNQMRFRFLKKTVQTVSYAPYFISTVVMVGMLNVFLSPSSGIVNVVIKMLGGTPVYFMGKPELFRSIYVWTNVWQTTGRSAIIYIAALTGVSMDLHEAAMVDGANKLQRTLHIDIPGILPTAVIMLILNLGQIMSLGFEKAYLMQNSLNITASEIISTYVYKIGLLGAQFSFSTAIGLFNSLINFVLVVAVNMTARKLGETSLW
ncbi:MAG: sugar ABC transporter permease [Clostridia bacterium]|nr:sugar ABC transporter permease [Clostridia bacterium]